jgi:GH15 family glucan-1,4-alpha-glucosidase
MASKIEDYGLIGDTHAAALVDRGGSIDWLCLPRFDSGAVFAALLGDETHGRWLLAPVGEITKTSRLYATDTLVLETVHRTAEGSVRVTDFMTPRRGPARVVRLVEGLSGSVVMRTELVLRFDYGSVVPWLQSIRSGVAAVAGPDAVELRTDIPLQLTDGTASGEFTIGSGQKAAFVLTWHPSHQEPPARIDPWRALRATQDFWRDWARRCTYEGEWRDAVMRSLITLKALTYRPTGGIVAAVTTSLPESLGGVRNWDYRFCWIRDATFTLYSLLMSGYEAEAKAWRDWLVRAVAGRPQELQIVYGLAGERRMPEIELPWLTGYEGSHPVRVGNAATDQFQLDVYGEVLDLLHQGGRGGLPHEAAIWEAEKAILDQLESCWREPDEGIWELRGEPRHFTHSKVMAWVAVDRAIRDIEFFGFEGPTDRWRALRAEIHDQVCREGYDAEQESFVEFYGSNRLDAALLMIPLVGFLPATDPRVMGTIDAVRRELMRDGFVARYRNDEALEGIPGEEAAFLMCTCWLADCLALIGRHRQARKLFENVLSVRNDLGLLSEEYDTERKRLVGNFPQAFSHVSLIDTARNLSSEVVGPAQLRRAKSPFRRLSRAPSKIARVVAGAQQLGRR